MTRKWPDKIAVLVFFLLLLDQFYFVWGRIVGLNYFIDESIMLDASVHFLKTLDYSAPHTLSHPFDPGVSSGLLCTFTHALGWFMGHTIFSARVFTSLYVGLFSGLLLYFSFRKLKYSSSLALVFTALVWLLSLKFPWSYGYIYDIAEIQGAPLGVVLGIILLLKTISYFQNALHDYKANQKSAYAFLCRDSLDIPECHREK
jgi:hypothetical protein